MNDEAAFALAWSVLPGASAEPCRSTPDPIASLQAARKDFDGSISIWPTCSRSGNASALAQVVDPIDPLLPQDDTHHLVSTMMNRLHDATVLAAAVIDPERPEQFVLTQPSQQVLW